MWQDATTESVIKVTKLHFTQHLISHMITDNGPQYSSDQFGPCSYLIKTDDGPCTDEILSSSVKTLVKDIRSPSWPTAAPPIGVHFCQSQEIPTWPYNERRKDIDAIHKWLPIHYSFVLVQISLPISLPSFMLVHRLGKHFVEVVNHFKETFGWIVHFEKTHEERSGKKSCCTFWQTYLYIRKWLWTVVNRCQPLPAPYKRLLNRKQ